MQQLKVTQNNNIRTVSLNRPLRRNAFDARLIEELTEQFLEIGRDKKLRAVVLTGEGTSFCSGGDLEWMKAAVTLSREDNLRDAERMFDMFKAIRDVPVPVIGRVFGHCFGGGLGLIAACDVVAAESVTQFCFSEVKWGLAPAVISPFVTERAAPHILREWFLTAKVFDASEARAGGLVNLTGTMAEVDAYVERTLRLFREAAPGASAATKRLHQDSYQIDWDLARQTTTRLIADRRTSDEGQAGLNCFLNKTKPDWTLGSLSVTETL